MSKRLEHGLFIESMQAGPFVAVDMVRIVANTSQKAAPPGWVHVAYKPGLSKRFATARVCQKAKLGAHIHSAASNIHHIYKKARLSFPAASQSVYLAAYTLWGRRFLGWFVGWPDSPPPTPLGYVCIGRCGRERPGIDLNLQTQSWKAISAQLWVQRLARCDVSVRPLAHREWIYYLHHTPTPKGARRKAISSWKSETPPDFPFRFWHRARGARSWQTTDALPLNIWCDRSQKVNHHRCASWMHKRKSDVCFPATYAPDGA